MAFTESFRFNLQSSRFFAIFLIAAHICELLICLFLGFKWWVILLIYGFATISAYFSYRQYLAIAKIKQIEFSFSSVALYYENLDTPALIKVRPELFLSTWLILIYYIDENKKHRLLPIFRDSMDAQQFTDFYVLMNTKFERFLKGQEVE